jgi:hypothetical protein
MFPGAFQGAARPKPETSGAACFQQTHSLLCTHIRLLASSSSLERGARCTVQNTGR